jgi:PAS domain S-box-containing protein
MVAIFVLDYLHNCQFLNAVAESLTGALLDGARGKSFEKVAWREQGHPFAESPLAKALKLEGGGEGEQPLLAADGTTRYFAFRVVPMGIGQGAAVIELTDLSGETGTARALREADQRLRLAVEATNIGIWDINILTGVRRWTPQFYEILGLSPDAPPDPEVFYSLIHPDDRERVRELATRAFSDATSGRYEAEFRICRADTHAERWAMTTGRITFDESARAMRGVGILLDTTERREAQAALAKREEQLRLALAAGRMGTWRWNLITGEQQWDAMQFHLLGLSSDLTPSQDLLRSVVHPDDLAKVDVDFRELPLDGDFLDAEYRVIWPNGQEHWLSTHLLVRYGEDRRPYEVIGVSHAITDRKRAEESLRISEERHRLAVEANDVGTWDYDLLSGEVRWSDQFKQLWGLPLDAPADRELLRPLLSAEDWFSLQTAWRAAEDPQGDGRINVEYQIHRADDSARRWCAFSGQVFFDDRRRKPVRAVGIMLDTTDRKGIEERQRLMLREMNHRVKNSLAVVQAIVSQTVRMTPDPAEAFERIQSRVMSIARTHDFLDRSSVGEASIRRLVAMEIEPFVDDMATRVRMDGPVILLESSPVLALGLTLHELATNAAKYGALSSPAGRIDVTWALRSEDDQTFVDIEWKESGGQGVLPPQRRGFGSRLIEGSIAGTLGGTVTLDYLPEGMVARLSFPLPAATTGAS